MTSEEEKDDLFLSMICLVVLLPDSWAFFKEQDTGGGNESSKNLLLERFPFKIFVRFTCLNFDARVIVSTHYTWKETCPDTASRDHFRQAQVSSRTSRCETVTIN